MFEIKCKSCGHVIGECETAEHDHIACVLCNECIADRYFFAAQFDTETNYDKWMALSRKYGERVIDRQFDGGVSNKAMGNNIKNLYETCDYEIRDEEKE